MTKAKKTTTRKRAAVKVPKAKAVPKERERKTATPEPERYFSAVGRRKTSIARVRLLPKGNKDFLVNGKPLDVYFKILELRQTAQSPLEKMGFLGKVGISAIVRGGGFRGQAEALRHGIARALVLFNPDFRKRLKKAGFLRRDPRMRERKKFGLKRARRAPQWQKR